MRALAGKGKAAIYRLYEANNRRRARSAPPPSTDRVHILLLHAYGMGGTIRTVFNLAGYLASTGREVEIVSILKEAEEPFFPVDPRVKFRFLDDRLVPRTGVRGRLSKMPSKLIPEQEAAYHRFNLWTDLQLARWIRSIDTGVIMATRPGLNLALAQLALPSVITIGQEHVALQGQPQPVQEMIKRRYRSFDALVTLTKADLRDYRETLRRKPKKLLRIPNAVPPMPGEISKLENKVVLAVGRMTKLKGFHRLITAWETVAAAHPDWKLRILGAGPQEDNLRAQITEAGLEGKVELPGPSNNVAGELEKASIFVLSSRHEGFPMTILEAMAKGLAIVSFNSPHGPKEMITDEVDGLLVKPRTNANLATAIMRVIEDEELRHRLAEGALATAATYDVDSIGARWDALLDELLARRNGTYVKPTPAAPPAQ
ncbi:glycosyltransferase family 4 protein [Nonomuraea dietziae]|uniref:Glycosyltransferase involved in cell wall biosynthesis n=1 Tax=Nonomuraea dietziae TaxID=65515 RepID=A0A7W5YD22_9ACTN|nr:glycosyltransferase family 4 protein [Nonomuraea dietziae]MBB3733026.1 glycosyltransferase involved in cell wall biosynthesis [Nonomuraea dietziae]